MNEGKLKVERKREERERRVEREEKNEVVVTLRIHLVGKFE